MDDNQKELKERLKKKYTKEDPTDIDHLVAVRYHTSNDEHIIDIPCLSWEYSDEGRNIEIYDGDNIHIIPLNGSIISVSLPEELEYHYYKKIDTKTKKKEWVKNF